MSLSQDMTRVSVLCSSTRRRSQIKSISNQQKGLTHNDTRVQRCIPGSAYAGHGGRTDHEKALRALLEDNISFGATASGWQAPPGKVRSLPTTSGTPLRKSPRKLCKGRALVIMHVGAISTASAVKAARTAVVRGLRRGMLLAAVLLPEH